MKKLGTAAMILMLLITFKIGAQTNEDSKVIADAKDIKERLIEKDSGLADFFENSAGYVIFPNVGKGAFIIGGASGNGVVYHNNEIIGMAGLKKVDVGLQAGGQAIAEVIFFETDRDVQKFKDGDFEFAAQASAVAVKSGKAKNAKYREGVVVFAMPKAGLMAEASVGGQKFSYTPF